MMPTNRGCRVWRGGRNRKNAREFFCFVFTGRNPDFGHGTRQTTPEKAKKKKFWKMKKMKSENVKKIEENQMKDKKVIIIIMMKKKER